MMTSESDRELANSLSRIAFRKGGYLYLNDWLEIVGVCRAHFIPEGHKVVECWGCEGKPTPPNDPCDVCGRSAKAALAASPTERKEG